MVPLPHPPLIKITGIKQHANMSSLDLFYSTIHVLGMYEHYAQSLYICYTLLARVYEVVHMVPPSPPQARSQPFPPVPYPLEP
ncbi:hypothetical protein GcC1_209045 [Golovinomyces cichoracearum]|uniref:Uncharacterized protein n=1 Tax=Golovinomyces cichoracearum TaxID=62708 RepID=A0A420HBG6_9PEZI|nr:hypothetical protein GcC1_209045 [Golovinomyces cichoracearum]